jgi:hypothetical protein
MSAALAAIMALAFTIVPASAAPGTTTWRFNFTNTGTNGAVADDYTTVLIGDSGSLYSAAKGYGWVDTVPTGAQTDTGVTNPTDYPYIPTAVYQKGVRLNPSSNPGVFQMDVGAGDYDVYVITAALNGSTRVDATQIRAAGTTTITTCVAGNNGTDEGIAYVLPNNVTTTDGKIYFETRGTASRACNVAGIIVVPDGAELWEVAGQPTVPPVITTTALPNAPLGEAYSQTIAYTGSSATGWTVSGSLPAGLTFSGGTIYGTPETAGTFNFTVRVTNAGGSAERDYTIQVSAVAPAITTASLPGALKDAAYSAALTASGTPPITWAVTSGALPAGLSLNASSGVISGTATTIGTSNFTVTASNSAGSAAKALSIAVTEAVGLDALPEALFYVEGQYVMDRGLIVAARTAGNFLSWRFFPAEATGYQGTGNGGATDGLSGNNFAIYRDGTKIADVTDSTDYIDASGTAASEYVVVTVDPSGAEISKSKTVKRGWTNSGNNAAYWDITLSKPPNGAVPSNNSGGTTSKAYSINDMSTGDADGDGVNELYVLWETDGFDVISEGYSAPVLIDCYKIDGTLLWRVDLGVNIRAGSHYTQYMVYDYDQDGKSEMMVKTAPGSRYKMNAQAAAGGAASGQTLEAGWHYITLPADTFTDPVLGVMSVAHTDDYRTNDGLSGVALESGKLFQWWVKYFENWHILPEVVNGNWKYDPFYLMEDFSSANDNWGTSYTALTGAPTALSNAWTSAVYNAAKNGAVSGVISPSSFRISNARAVALTKMLAAFAWYKGGGSSRSQTILDQQGYIYTGPEYLTCFLGDGSEGGTVDFPVPRGDIGIMWGDFVGNRSETLNRPDRFLAGVAHLDGNGENASGVFGRGYYTRSTVSRGDWNGYSLSAAVIADTGFTVYQNPFSEYTNGASTGGPHGRLGRNTNWTNGVGATGDWSSLAGQGFHNLSIADVDGDGYDEIIYGSATLNHDGTIKYSSRLNAANIEGGDTSRIYVYNTTGGLDGDYLGHGDSLHVADIIPERPGLEIWTCHESATALGEAMRDGTTGQILFGGEWAKDNGRAATGDFVTGNRGWESSTATASGTAMGLRSGAGATARGAQISTGATGNNFTMFWKANMTTQVTSSGEDSQFTIVSYSLSGMALSSTDMWSTSSSYISINTTKAVPPLVVDLVGDYREELIARNSSNTSIRIFTNNSEDSQHKLPTFLADRRYREEIARQQSAYNQPTYPSYYYGSDMIPATLYASIQEPPVIVTETLPAGETGTPYSQRIEATGSDPITFTLQSGSLPAGLTLTTDGLVSGTPASAGTYTFTIRAANEYDYATDPDFMNGGTPMPNYDDQAYTVIILGGYTLTSSGAADRTLTFTNNTAAAVTAALIIAVYEDGTDRLVKIYAAENQTVSAGGGTAVLTALGIGASHPSASHHAKGFAWSQSSYEPFTATIDIY